jgi:prolyl-tRNA editing enzyme YbaK/EbsC (Cys-tRNA(Pro) deacylase)
MKIIQQNLKKLIDRLTILNLRHEIIEHRPITTVEEGLKELGIEAADGVSTLIMKADDTYISIIRRDDKKLSFKKIKKLLKVHDLAFADREKLKELTQSDIGYVSLYNQGFEPLFDSSILEREYVYGGTGSPEHDLKIKPKDLVTLTNAQIVDIVV